MKAFIKQALKVLAAYTVAAGVFTFFVIAPVSMNNNQTLWLLLYSFVMFIFMAFIVSRTILSIGKYERYDKDTKTFSSKGFFYGLAAMLPYMLLGLIHLIIYHDTYDLGLRIFHYAFRCALGPMYFIINTLDYTWYGFTLAYLMVPVISLIWYFVGLKGLDKIELRKKIKDDEEFLK